MRSQAGASSGANRIIPKQLRDEEKFAKSKSELCLALVLHAAECSVMETTLTIRLPKKQREALRQRAAAEQRSESALVREMIEREINRGIDFERVRHLAGSVKIDSKKLRGDAWAESIRASNWRK